MAGEIEAANAAERQQMRESILRLEAKIDVVLSQHDGKISDLTRRQGETDSTLREHDSRITANALTTAETRALVTAAQADVQTLRNDVARDIADIKTLVTEQRPKNQAAWAAIALSGCAMVVTLLLEVIRATGTGG